MPESVQVPAVKLPSQSFLARLKLRWPRRLCDSEETHQPTNNGTTI